VKSKTLLATKGRPVISGAQVRAARALLGWTAHALAVKASVPIFTIEWIEGEGKITGSDRKALAAVQQILEADGVEFIGLVGVQLHPKKRGKVSAADKNVRRLQQVVKRISGLL